MWTSVDQEKEQTIWLSIPSQLNEPLEQRDSLRFFVLALEKGWSPDWKAAAFDLKNLIITVKTKGPRVLVGVEGSESQLNALMEHEMAAYIDGYLFDDAPFIPDADETGKLWQKASTAQNQILATLIDAASIGIQAVLFRDMTIDAQHRAFLDFVANTPTGSLDLQPEIMGLPQDTVLFFFDPQSGNYHLAVYGQQGVEATLAFELASGLKASLLYPETARFEQMQYGQRTELRLMGDAVYYFFLLEPETKAGQSESLQIIEKASIDPYELVVQNQVFKDKQRQKFESLIVEELQNYRYQTPGGVAIDVSYKDTVIIRKGQPNERLRREFYLGGVKWRKKKLPELPLIQPEKVQSVPLDVDLDKSYQYAYLGEDVVNQRRAWKVRFQPKDKGNFFAGTVWIDQENGAHLKLRATQSGLEAPVVGNEVTAFFDWVEYEGERYWTQVKENNLQILTVSGLRLALQIDSVRSDFRFNESNVDQVLEDAYQSDLIILKDTDKGFRYLRKKGGKRVLSEEVFSKQKALLGGLFFDPSRDSPVVPLAGFNYTNLDFLGKQWQANFFIAGAINDVIVSNPNFLGKSWDLTGELFLSAIKFSDRVFQNSEERLDLEIEELRESANITLGIPLNSFFRFSANYGFRYLDYSDASDTDPDYIVPVSTFEHIGRVTLQFSRKRFTSELEYEFVKRGDWERFGYEPGSEKFLTAPEQFEDAYSSIRLDASISKRLPKFQTIAVDFRFLKGWNQDRFSRFGFGFFENRISGFGSSGAEGNQAARVTFDYDIGISGIFNLNLQLDAGRAWLDDTEVNGVVFRPERDTVDLVGLGVAANFLGPWGTLIRLDLGYGLASDLKGEEGDVTGQIVFLKLF